MNWAAAAAFLAGLAWIPIRYAIGVTYSRPLFGLAYIDYNRLEAIPLLLMLAAVLAMPALVRTSMQKAPAWVAAVGLVLTLMGLVLEFYIGGGLQGGPRELAMAGWMVYLLGLLVHALGMVWLGAVLVWGVRHARAIGALVLAIGVLHLAMAPLVIAEWHVLAVFDQALIGMGWMALALPLARRASTRSLSV
jgi:hypothetical protein